LAFLARKKARPLGRALSRFGNEQGGEEGRLDETFTVVNGDEDGVVDTAEASGVST